jgi:hypothetical protein
MLEKTVRKYNLRDAGAVLVVWSEVTNDVWSQLKATLGSLVKNANSDETQPSSPTGVIDGILQESASEGATRMRYCGSDPGVIEAAIQQAAAQGCRNVLVVPVALAMERSPNRESLHPLSERIAALNAHHPNTEIVYLGPPFDRVHEITSVLATAHQQAPETDSLLQGAVERGFKGDWALFARFMETFQKSLPVDTRVALRGSVVTGENYQTGQPFDANGPGTSDLDLVLMGESAMAEWKPEAFFFPGVNTLPLSDEMPDIAPRLEPVRDELQRMVNRPVNIQAMQKWFLDMRSELQGTPYIFLDA